MIGLLYFANLSKDIQKTNYDLKNQINFIEHQININELEYSLYNGYEYLEKMKKIYLSEYENTNSFLRISYNEFRKRNIKNFYTVGIK